jgi:ferredoxin-NADP reductase
LTHQLAPSRSIRILRSQLRSSLEESELRLFLSIVQQAAHDRLPHFYSNRRPEDAPFLDILENLEKTNRSFRFVGTMTEMMHSKREWHGEMGLIDKTMLSNI